MFSVRNSARLASGERILVTGRDPQIVDARSATVQVSGRFGKMVLRRSHAAPADPRGSDHRKRYLEMHKA